MARDSDKTGSESIGPALRLSKIEPNKPQLAQIDPSNPEFNPLEKIESTLDEISNELKEQTKILNEILTELKKK